MKAKKIPAFIVMFIVLLFLTILFIVASSKITNSPVPATNTGNNNPANNNLGNNTNNNNNNMCGANGCPMMITLNSQEVAKHNSANDCWMIINGGVYDLTDFLNLHSGGSQFILEYCGQDGSVGFNTKDQTGSHSSRDLAILNQYYLGDLGQQIKG
jgi:cytochrome b involved in lipid metabolism